jgi:hypothetical protein
MDTTKWTKWNFILSVIALVVSSAISIISLCKSDTANEQSNNATNIAAEANAGTITNAQKLDSIVVEQNNINNKINTINTTIEKSQFINSPSQTNGEGGGTQTVTYGK